MCGIFAAISKENSLTLIKPALNKLAYRGYDSAGISYIKDGLIITEKIVGHPELLPDLTNKSKISMGHNRWATHGSPSKTNAHPHISNNKKIAVVHNGIVENYFEIKKELISNGFSFYSETDTEVIPNLIQFFLKDYNIEDAILYACKKIRGAYAFSVMSADHPNSIFAAKLGSPLCVGISDNSVFITSDKIALPLECNNHMFIEDGSIISVKEMSISTKSFCGNDRALKLLKTNISEVEYSIGGYSSFLEKEIFEQPMYVDSAISGRIDSNNYNVKLSGISKSIDFVSNAKQIIFTGCGSALYAAEIGAYVMESFSKIPCRSISAGELKYFDAAIDDNTVVIAVSQSGETADTLGCLSQAKKMGAKTIGIVNVPGSSISREVDCGLYIRAGIEKSVASTKAFTNQIIAMISMALLIGQKRGMSKDLYRSVIDDVASLPNTIEKIVNTNSSNFNNLSEYQSMIVIGRGLLLSAAKEISLKIKEITYIHSEAYSASELKHGPLALISESCPTIVLSTNDGLENKLLSNMREITSRGGEIYFIGSEESPRELINISKSHILYPKTKTKIIGAVCSIVCGQIVALNLAKKLSRPIDRPRNLAKSVTVE